MKIDHTFQLRGRPVGFVEKSYGGELVALERGYFPVSETGYRSLAGMRRDAVTSDMLESLAKARDLHYREIMQRAEKVERPRYEPFIGYISTSSMAEQAFQNGFFARDEERQRLWTAAHRLFNLIENDRGFQPTPNDRWDEAACARALQHIVKCRTALEQFARADFTPLAESIREVPRAYFDLPVRTDDEPAIILGAFTQTLPIDFGVTSVQEKKSVVDKKVGKSGDDFSQLRLFGDAENSRGPGPRV